MLRRTAKPPPCPNVAAHTEGPAGYLSLWAIWTPKAKPGRA